MAYPLLFIYGDGGWQHSTYTKDNKNIKKDFLITQHLAISDPIPFDYIIGNEDLEKSQELDESNHHDPESVALLSTKTKYITAREYYAYQFQDRIGKKHITLFIILFLYFNACTRLITQKNALKYFFSIFVFFPLLFQFPFSNFLFTICYSIN